MTSWTQKLSNRKVGAPPRRSCRDCGADVAIAVTLCRYCGGANVEDEPARSGEAENFFVATLGARTNNIRRPDA
jgi:hypothetical protein